MNWGAGTSPSPIEPFSCSSPTLTIFLQLLKLLHFLASAFDSFDFELFCSWFPTWYQSIVDLFEDCEWLASEICCRAEFCCRNFPPDFWEIGYGWGKPTPVRWHELLPLGVADEISYERASSLESHSGRSDSSGSSPQSVHRCYEAARRHAGPSKSCGFHSSQRYVRCDPDSTRLLWNSQANLG